MAYLETIIGLSVKEILEFLVVFVAFALVYFSYKTYSDLRFRKSLFESSFKWINFGFIFLFLSMLFELLDSFYLKVVFDNLQLIFGVLAFILLFIGFRKGFQMTGGNQNA